MANTLRYWRTRQPKRKRKPRWRTSALGNWRKTLQISRNVPNLLEKETEELRAKNLAIQKLLLPRRVFMAIHPDKGFVYDELRKFRGTTALIQVVPDDFEAKKLAIDVFEVLNGSGFKARYVQSSETHLEPTEIWDGISVHTGAGTLRPSQVNRGLWAGRAIGNWLDATNVNPWPVAVWDDLFPKSDPLNRLKFDAPEDTVLVTVGLKPVAEALGQSSLDIQIVDPNNPIK